jgi:hypothetical protein
MAVELIVDQWNPSTRRYRTEAFCNGPRSCPLYRSGAARKVPGRRGMTYTEEEWSDDEATSNRGPDELNGRAAAETANDPDRNFRKVEGLKTRDPAAPSNFCGAPLANKRMILLPLPVFPDPKVELSS